MTNESEPPLPLPVSCTVSRVIRALFDWDQQRVASALGMERKALSALERCTKGVAITRDEIERYVEKLHRPVSVVEEAFACVLRIGGLAFPQPTGLDAGLRTLAERVGTTYGRQFYETTVAASREMLMATEREIAASLWRHFLTLPKAARRGAVETEAMFRSWAFAERLWRESLNAAADEADRAFELGEMAVAVAQRYVGDLGFASRLQGLALSAVANARRVRSELGYADRDLARAKELWEAGAAGDPGILDEACFLALESALRVDQRRFPEALACIEAAFAAAKPDAEVAYLLISKGKILYELQQHEEAATIYREAAARLGPSASRREKFGVLFNLTGCLIATGRPDEAQAYLPSLREMATAIGNGLDLLRVKWLDGQAKAALLNREQAIATLGDVRDAFLLRGILFDAALVSLERAAMQLEAGQLEAVREEAPGLAEAFRLLGVTPELLAAVSLFWAAALAEKATAEHARLVHAQLRQTASTRASAV